MGGNILRAFRPSGVHERVARARRTWGELSLAEQIAIGGLGGLGALTAARLLLGPRGDETRELVDRYAKAKEHEKGVIAGLCTSRVHDLRDLLLDTKRANVARMIFSAVEKRLDSSVTHQDSRNSQLAFIRDALSPLNVKFDPGFGVQSMLCDNVHMEHSRMMRGLPCYPPDYRDAYATVRVGDFADIPSDRTVERWKLQQIPKDASLREIVGSVAGSNHDQYGHIAVWDVRMVESMARAFEYSKVGLFDMAFWDTRRVVDMACMFKGAKHFNGNISNWDTRNVTNMSCMFEGAKAFNGDISDWNVVAENVRPRLRRRDRNEGKPQAEEAPGDEE
jgi:surface protein